MKIAFYAFLLTTLWANLGPCTAADAPSLDSHLEPLRPLLEKTWKGPFKNSTPDKPTVDVARWERALNGRAVRVVHSINDGIYGGEILMMWDEKKQQVTYNYFTTAGFTSAGTVRFESGKILTHEIVTGNDDGVTEVRGVTEFNPDGSYHVKSEYLKKGQWVPGHEATYHEDGTAKVVFH
jgi:hypothetical protein